MTFCLLSQVDEDLQVAGPSKPASPKKKPKVEAVYEEITLPDGEVIRVGSCILYWNILTIH